MTSAVWEAYVEDVCGDAVDVIASRLEDPTRLPDMLKTEIAAEIHRRYNDNSKNQKDRDAAWNLAGNGWKQVVKQNLDRIKQSNFMGQQFNSCKSQNVSKLFERAIGLEQLQTKWTWAKSDSLSVSSRLDAFISLRGELAHRGKADSPISKSQCKSFLTLVERLVESTEVAVSSHLIDLTGHSFEHD